MTGYPTGRVSCFFNPTTGLYEAVTGANGAGGAQLYAYQPSSLSVVPLTLDALGNLNVVGIGGGGGSNAAAGLTGLPVPTSAGYTGWNSGGSLVGAALTAALPVQPGTGASWAVTGTFWQATQPVSGTFWQATQPVSGTVTTTPPADATTNLTKVGGTAVTLGAKTSAASIPVVLASDEAALPVTGTFFQATQPVSGTVTANQGTANTAANAWPAKITDGTNVGAVKAASTAAVATDPAQVVVISPNNSVAVTGTFWQATQPVSGTVTTTPPVNASTNVAQFGGTNVSTGTGAGGAGIPRVTVSNDSNVLVTPPTLTKGTQGATGFSVQDLRDAGRNVRIFMLDAFTAAPLAEAVQTVVQWYGNAAVAGTTQPAVVPAGKTLRLTGWKIMYQSLATVGAAVVRVRCNTAGLGVLASPLVFSFEAGTNSGATTTAVTGAMTTETGEFPEGIDIPAAAGLAFSMAGYGPTGTLTLEGTTRFMVYGYEF